MDESETTEDEHTVLKTVTSDRQAKKKIAANVHLLKENQKQILTPWLSEKNSGKY